MDRNMGRVLLVLLAACASTVLAFAQALSSQTDISNSETSTSPVAFVYVSANPGGAHPEVNAYTSSTDGTLKPIAGSPFAADVQGMAVSSKYLFGESGVFIHSYAIDPDGSLREVSSVNAQRLTGTNCGGPWKLFLDRMGQTLYDLAYLGSQCANNALQSFRVGPFTGELAYLEAISASPAVETALSFIGNNEYGYTASCYHFGPQIFAYHRKNNDTLMQININPPIPAGPSGKEYCPWLGAADPTNHVAIALAPIFASNWQEAGPWQIAVYTAHSWGNLTTTSTHSNMPTTAAGDINDIRISPSGMLLAVGGSAGLQVFHFNGANPVRHYTALLTNDPISQVFWDDANHLYALSGTAGKLYVFTVTPTSVREAPGSPHEIANPVNLAVLPKT
jgi:hypothetical protein